MLKDQFKPEFLNRVDEIVVFHALKTEHLDRIIDVQLARVQDRLRDKHITLEVTEAAKKLLVEKGYDANFGARPLKRTIQDLILNPLAIKLLEGAIKEDSTVKVDVRKGEIVLA